MHMHMHMSPRCEATAELKKEMLEAVVGAVFLVRGVGVRGKGEG